MSKKLLIPITIIVATLLVVLYINQGLFSLGWNYIRYRYFSEERETTEFRDFKENPFTKYMDDNPDLSLDQSTDGEEDSLSSTDSSNLNSDDTSEGMEKSEAVQKTIEVNSPSDDNTEVAKPPANQTSSGENGKLTLAQISNEYLDKFTDMETDFKNDLESMMDSAISDYNSGSSSKLDLADIYLKKGESLEIASDKKFYKLLTDLEKKLIDNSHSNKMVEEVEDYYKEFKDYEKNRIMDKGMALLED